MTEKEKKKKLILKVNKQNLNTLNCPCCDQEIVIFYAPVETVRHIKYCYECGQRLDWDY